MKCPYCCEEMKKGYITSDARFMAWREERYESAFVQKNSGGIQLAWGTSVVSNAYCCKLCKKIMIDFGESVQEP